MPRAALPVVVVGCLLALLLACFGSVLFFDGRFSIATWAISTTRSTYPTLAEVLAARGFATAGFVANTHYCNAQFGLGRGFARYEDCLENERISAWEAFRSSELGRRIDQAVFGSQLSQWGAPRKEKDAARINRDALAWLTDDRRGPTPRSPGTLSNSALAKRVHRLSPAVSSGPVNPGPPAAT